MYKVNDVRLINELITPLIIKTVDLTRFKLIEPSEQISNTIWNWVSQWNYFNKDTIGKQLTRAADSISANLSEAYGRYSFADRKRFAYYARGSLCETIQWIRKSIDRGLIEKDDGELILEQLSSLSHRLNYYINSLKQPH